MNVRELMQASGIAQGSKVHLILPEGFPRGSEEQVTASIRAADVVVDVSALSGSELHALVTELGALHVCVLNNPFS